MEYPIHRHRSVTTGAEYILVPKCGCNSMRDAINRSNAGGSRVPVNFVFTFVRHPLARFVSAYVEKVQTGKVHILMPKWKNHLSPNMSAAEFLDFIVGFPHDQELLNDHFCPQSWLLRHVELDFVGRLENVAEDWKVLMERGLPELPHLHKTPNVKPWQDMLDESTEQKAREFYRDDFDRWPGWWK